MSSHSKGNSSEMVKPNCTIRKRHDRLLDELEEERYASRSEAIRTAIDSLAESVQGSGLTKTDQLIKQVANLESQIDKLAEQLDEIQQNRLEPSNTAPPSQDLGSSDNDVTSAVDVSDSGGSAKLMSEIYDILTENGPKSIPEITDKVDRTGPEVHKSIANLVDENYVKYVDDSETPRFDVKTPSN